MNLSPIVGPHEPIAKTTHAPPMRGAMCMDMCIERSPKHKPTVADVVGALSAAVRARAVDADRPLARVWTMIAAALDGDVSLLASGRALIWMPAHGPVSSIGHALKSDGQEVTAIDWRANRLADALAKSAIGDVRDGCEELVLREAAVLGACTAASTRSGRTPAKDMVAGRQTDATDGKGR